LPAGESNISAAEMVSRAIERKYFFDYGISIFDENSPEWQTGPNGEIAWRGTVIYQRNGAGYQTVVGNAKPFLRTLIRHVEQRFGLKRKYPEKSLGTSIAVLEARQAYADLKGGFGRRLPTGIYHIFQSASQTSRDENFRNRFGEEIYKLFTSRYPHLPLLGLGHEAYVFGASLEQEGDRFSWQGVNIAEKRRGGYGFVRGSGRAYVQELIKYMQNIYGFTDSDAAMTDPIIEENRIIFATKANLSENQIIQQGDAFTIFDGGVDRQEAFILENYLEDFFVSPAFPIRLYGLVIELLINALVRPSPTNIQPVQVKLTIYKIEPKGVVLKLAIEQNSIPADKWLVLKRNAQLTLDQLNDINFRRSNGLLQHRGGLAAYVELARENIPLRLQYDRNQHEGMTSTLWVALDHADFNELKKWKSEIGRNQAMGVDVIAAANMENQFGAILKNIFNKIQNSKKAVPNTAGLSKDQWDKIREDFINEIRSRDARQVNADVEFIFNTYFNQDIGDFGFAYIVAIAQILHTFALDHGDHRLRPQMLPKLNVSLIDLVFHYLSLFSYAFYLDALKKSTFVNDIKADSQTKQWIHDNRIDLLHEQGYPAANNLPVIKAVMESYQYDPVIAAEKVFRQIIEDELAKNRTKIFKRSGIDFEYFKNIMARRAQALIYYDIVALMFTASSYHASGAKLIKVLGRGGGGIAVSAAYIEKDPEAPDFTWVAKINTFGRKNSAEAYERKLKELENAKRGDLSFIKSTNVELYDHKIFPNVTHYYVIADREFIHGLNLMDGMAHVPYGDMDRLKWIDALLLWNRQQLELGYINRDVNPANSIIDENGKLRLVDPQSVERYKGDWDSQLWYKRTLIHASIHTLTGQLFLNHDITLNEWQAITSVVRDDFKGDPQVMAKLAFLHKAYDDPRIGLDAFFNGWNAELLNYTTEWVKTIFSVNVAFERKKDWLARFLNIDADNRRFVEVFGDLNARMKPAALNQPGNSELIAENILKIVEIARDLDLDPNLVLQQEVKIHNTLFSKKLVFECLNDLIGNIQESPSQAVLMDKKYWELLQALAEQGRRERRGFQLEISQKAEVGKVTVLATGKNYGSWSDITGLMDLQRKLLRGELDAAMFSDMKAIKLVRDRLRYWGNKIYWRDKYYKSPPKFNRFEFDELRKELGSSKPLNEEKIFLIVMKILDGPDEIWRKQEGQKSEAQKALRELFEDIERDPQRWKSEWRFFLIDKILFENFSARARRRLEVFGRELWNVSPRLGVRMLLASVHDFFSAYRENTVKDGANNMSHYLVDNLYLWEQRKIAWDAVGKDKLRELVEAEKFVPFSESERAQIPDFFDSDDFPLGPNPFRQQAEKFIKKPVRLLLLFIQYRLEDAVTDFEEVYGAAINEAQQKFFDAQKEERVTDVKTLDLSDIVKITFNDGRKPLYAVVADVRSRWGRKHLLALYGVDRFALTRWKKQLLFRYQAASINWRSVNSITKLKLKPDAMANIQKVLGDAAMGAEAPTIEEILGPEGPARLGQYLRLAKNSGRLEEAVQVILAISKQHLEKSRIGERERRRKYDALIDLFSFGKRSIFQGHYDEIIDEKLTFIWHSLVGFELNEIRKDEIARAKKEEDYDPTFLRPEEDPYFPYQGIKKTTPNLTDRRMLIGFGLAALGVIFSMKMAKDDKAMRGGIDLNSANLTLHIKRDGNGVPLPLAQQDLAQLSNIQGLDPVILSIKPASQTVLFSELMAH
jgi:hypothetical protein